MQSNIKQEPQKVQKQNYFIRWMKNFLFILLGILGCLITFVVALGVYLVFAPLNITPAVKYWLPISIIKGVDKHHPAGSLTFEKFVLTWPIRSEGFSAPLELELKRGQILNSQKQEQGRIGYAKITLVTSSLFNGVIKPISINIDDADLRFRRTKSQKIQLDLSHQSDVHSKGKFNFSLKKLAQITIKNSHLKLIDEAQNKVIQLKEIDMNLRPFSYHNTLAAVGHVVAVLDIDGRLVNISAQSGADGNIEIAKQLLDQTGLLNWHIKLDQVNPSDFSGLSPSLHSLAQIDVPISATADISLRAGKDQLTIEPYDAKVTVNVGKGKVSVKGQNLYPSSLIAHMHAQFSTDLNQPLHFDINDMVLQLRSPNTLDQDQSGPLFQFSGSLFLSSILNTQTIKANLNAQSPKLDFATIKDYWPAMIAKGAHEWVIENITAGQVQGFKIDAGLESHEGWEHLKLVHLGGGIAQAEHVEVHWLRPVPPLQEMKASLQFVDPTRIHILFEGGYQVVNPKNKPTNNPKKVAVPKGDMWITGLDDHEETGIITTEIKGRLQDLIALLYEPRLKLLSRHPLPFKHPSGDVSVVLKVNLPLKKKVKIEQITIQGHNVITNANIDNVALGKPLKDASLIVDVDTEHLELTGKGIFSVFPVNLKYLQNFSHKNEQSVTEKAEAKLDITPENLKQMKVDTSGDFQGHTALTVNYEKLHSGKAEVHLQFDLLKAAVKLPIWQKVVGQPAKIVGRVLLDKNKLVDIQDIHASGQDMSIQANIGVIRNTPQQLNITSFKIGRSTGQASLNFPMTKEAIDSPERGDIRLSVMANTLDVVPFVQEFIGKKKVEDQNNIKTSTPKKDEKYQLPIAATGRYTGPKGRRWVVNLQAQKIYYEQEKFFSNVTAYMEYNGVRLMRLSYGMRKPFLLSASLFPKGGNRYFYSEAQDFGHILQTIGLSTQLKGGRIVFKGKFDDTLPSAPFSGQVNIKDITLENSPKAMRQLSDASIYGLFKTRKRKEIVLDTIVGNVSLNEGLLKISDGLLHNDELGATLQGEVNLNKSQLNLKGTIIPVYAINKLFGYFPGIGKFFSPEKGGGFVAIPFDINGSFKDPDWEIYPSRLFTPGVLRELF